MSSARPALVAERRTVTGKAVAHLRRDGRLPAVVYGHGLESAPVTIDAHEFDLLRRRVGPNALIDLKIEGAKPTPVLIHGVQIHKVNRRPIHVDLFAVRMTEEITVEVPVHGIGDSEAVSRHGGTLLNASGTVRAKARPDHLPQAFEVDLSSLVDFDATIHVRDIVVPEGVTILADPDDIIFKVAPPRIQEAEVPVGAEAGEAAEGAEGAEGGEGAAAEGGEA
jgi:large subunit ribosomal protein L25